MYFVHVCLRVLADSSLALSMKCQNLSRSLTETICHSDDCAVFDCVNLLTSNSTVMGCVSFPHTCILYLPVCSTHCFLGLVLHLLCCINTNSFMCLWSGSAEALFGGDQTCQERHLQSLNVWLLPGGGDGAPEGEVSRPPAALGADSPL